MISVTLAKAADQSTQACRKDTINRSKPGRLQDELLTLCDRFEAAERYGDGDLDTL
jgi:hypothetical protein